MSFKLNMVNYCVNKSAKFSYSVVRGNVATRIAKAQDLNNQIYSKIKDNLILSQKKSLELSELIDIFCSVFPEKKNFSLVKINKKNQKIFDASADYLLDSYSNIVGHIVEVPIKKNCFAMVDIPTLMHELTHVFDKMFNPKIMKRTAKLSKTYECKTKSYIDLIKYNKLYNKLYGVNYEKFTNDIEKAKVIELRKQEVLNFLKSKTLEEKMDIIQNLRYQLELELNAYNVENQFIDRMTPKGEDLSSLKVNVDKYLFKEKIQMLKNIGFKLVSDWSKVNKKRVELMKLKNNS